MAENEGWKCLVSDSWRHLKLQGNEAIQISIGPHFLEISQKAQRDLTHPVRAAGLISGLYGFLSEISKISKPAHLGGYGYRCVPGRYQEADSLLYCKRTHGLNTYTSQSFLYTLYFISLLSCSLDQMATILPLIPMDMCCSTLISSHR